MTAPATPQNASERPVAQMRGAGFIYGAIAVALMAALPLFANDYIVAVAVRMLIFIALGQAWNVVAGIGGLLSLGHGVFLGIGCYAAGILFNDYGLPPWLGVWVGALVSLAVALLMGAMTLRMRGVFFALATIAVSLALDQLARHYVDLTGGDNGLALRFLGNSLWFMQSRTPAPFLYAGLIFVIAYYWITRWVLASRLGSEMEAVRDDEQAAAAAGVAVFRTKLLGLLLSAVMTSFAGTLYMQFYQAIDPETAFGLSQAIQLQLPALIGGLGTSWGPIVGGAVMILLSESTNFGSTKLGIAGVDILVYGLLLLAVVMYAPKGIMGLFGSRTRVRWRL
jgi:branched-chain amino acid transport system permease protein